MKSVLITGSRGFVGTHLKDGLAKRNYSPIDIDWPDADVLDKSTFDRHIDDEICHVFHLAAKTFVPESWTQPLAFYQTNVMGTANVLDFCRMKGVPLTYVSAYLYGQPLKLPISEKDPIIPNNPYAHSKCLAEQLCAFYAKEFNVRITIIRPFNIYGVGQNVKFLVPQIIMQGLYETTIKVKDMAPKRDYVYIDDVIDALLLTMNQQSPFNIFNIGSGISTSVKELIDMILDILQSNKQVVSENLLRKNELNDVVADISKAQKELHWNPKYSIREGLGKMILYEKANRGNEPTSASIVD